MRENLNVLWSMRVRDFVSQMLLCGILISGILVAWRAICIVPQCENPVVVVVSGSMEPGYRRGDILLLHNMQQRYPVQAGDIIVYTLPGRPMPIVHRVYQVHTRQADGKRFFMTKGDNNAQDDRALLNAGLDWVEEEMVLGKSFACIPYLGYVTVMFQEVALLKYVSLGLIGFFLLTSQE